MSAMRGPPAVLVAIRVPDAFREHLASRFDVLVPGEGPFPEAVAAMNRVDAERVRVVVTYGTLDTSAAALDRLPALRLVCCLGSGYEGVDLAAARERGIVVTHSPGANASAVADLAVGLMVASIRRIAEGDAYVRRGDWGERESRRSLQARGLTGRKVGVWGLGAIGTRIAVRCEAFEMEVAYHGRSRHAGARYPFHATLVDLAAWADVLMIAVRAGPVNRRAVDVRVLAALGPEGHVVNITRGSVIDEGALIAALRDGVIAGAGLDVFEREPEVPAELRALPNVVLTPHLGGNTDEAQAAMQDAVLENIDAFIAGHAVPAPVPGSATGASVAAG